MHSWFRYAGLLIILINELIILLISSSLAISSLIDDSLTIRPSAILYTPKQLIIVKAYMLKLLSSRSDIMFSAAAVLIFCFALSLSKRPMVNCYSYIFFCLPFFKGFNLIRLSPLLLCKAIISPFYTFVNPFFKKNWFFFQLFFRPSEIVYYIYAAAGKIGSIPAKQNKPLQPATIHFVMLPLQPDIIVLVSVAMIDCITWRHYSLL